MGYYQLRKGLEQAVKSNRGITRGFLPTDIANLLMWLKPNVGITKDGIDAVSVWADQSGNGNDITQAVGADQPLWVDNLLNGYPAIRFDGVSEYLKAAAFAWTQPETVYIVFNQIAWTSLDKIFAAEGVDANGSLWQRGTSPEIQGYAGVVGAGVSPALGSFDIITIIFNGASSLIQLNDAAPNATDFGTGDLGGFSLGASSGGGRSSNMEAVEIVGYAGAHTTAQISNVVTYLKDRYAI